MSIVIHHNPDCGTSRNVLALFAAAGLTPRTALRVTKSPAEALGLLDPSVDDDTLIDAMLEYPVLVNRPIVCTSRGVRLCRPSETVLDLLDRLPPGQMSKEDGTLLIDAEGHRVG
ncbi:arsenate reductase (glutaredoxin) [Roseovarius sp. LXJ103]|uniref:ArsC/Spx/MgsR family protein n=1 Tax=Roseovarius carneus TaxID=2853164 RepID=UPI000D61BAF9|nr:ArsC/Spx/MgsR family protein [Roseovarius carneus]MBZ8117041.1 arsenate reductase (glutaredoxin) [Roseovarius carneus]PWE37109.1 arsenate reductase (glutaredoxin) [Pelagicola sp. LXJ1103]